MPMTVPQLLLLAAQGGTPAPQPSSSAGAPPAQGGAQGAGTAGAPVPPAAPPLPGTTQEIPVSSGAELKAAIERVLAEAEARQAGGRQQVVVRPNITVTPEAANQVKEVAGAGMAFILALALGVPLMRAFARRIAGPQQVVRGPDHGEELRRLQESVDAMAIELERISEAQRFQAKLMHDRAKELPPG